MSINTLFKVVHRYRLSASAVYPRVCCTGNGARHTPDPGEEERWFRSAIDFGAPKVGGADALVVLEVAGVALDGDLAEFQDVAVTCDTQCLAGVLFHQEDGDALFLVDLPDDPEDLLDDDGGKSYRWFVEQQDTGFRDESAPDGQHLLFTTRERPSQLLAPFLEDGEEGEDPLLGFLQFLAGRQTADAVGTQVQIFLRREGGKDVPSLRHMRDAQPREAKGGRRDKVFS